MMTSTSDDLDHWMVDFVDAVFLRRPVSLHLHHFILLWFISLSSPRISFLACFLPLLTFIC